MEHLSGAKKGKGLKDNMLTRPAYLQVFLKTRRRITIVREPKAGIGGWSLTKDGRITYRLAEGNANLPPPDFLRRSAKMREDG